MKGLARMIRSLFGLSDASSSESGSERESDITVEREPDTESEDAVKGTDTASTETDTAAEESTEENVMAEVDDETEPAVEDAAADEQTDEGQADKERADEGQSDDEQADDDSETDAETGDADGPGSESVEEINGIGPTYGERLGEAGLGTVAALADSDAETVADAAQASESRAQDWIDSANDRL